MSPAAKKTNRPLLRRWWLAPLALFRSARWTRQAVVVLLAIVFMVAGSLGVWAKVRSHVQAQTEYLVPLSAIEITPPPAWIHADIKAQVIQDSGLPRKLSILDDRLAQRLSHAFALHPWIARVDGVHTSYPAQLHVDLSYRRPIAMVAVYGGLLPVDSEGVLLPTEDFTPQEAQKYPRIVGVSSSPLGPIGTRWSDTLVEAAAKLAELLSADWQPLALHHILIQEQISLEEGRHLELQLVTRAGTQFMWGPPLGQESADEPDANAKLQRLKQLAASSSLDAAAPKDRDLRH